MTLFHEIYGLYFRIAAHILDRECISEAEVQQVIQAEGFQDTVLFLPQKLIPQTDGSDWGLLRRSTDGTLKRIPKHSPPRTVTKLQKRWLKTKLQDPRMRLFLEDETFRALEQHLADVQPLWKQGLYCYTDQFSDGDDYNSENYRQLFRTLLAACRSHELLDITFSSGSGQNRCFRCLPFSIEYSRKNDKFRIYARQMSHGKLRRTIVLNAGRITGLARTGICIQTLPDMKSIFASRQCKTPVTVRVTQERNALERFMLEFAAYKKRTEFDPETGICTVQLWYDLTDETELLIRLLSFGPVLEIISPAGFRRQAAMRVRQQYALLHPETELDK